MQKEIDINFYDREIIKSFDDIFIDDSKNVTKISSDKYLSSGEIAIIDQGKKMIAGYVKGHCDKICREQRIIFGDHTRIFKYVNFPFVCGADGTKVLKIKDPDKYDYKYMYYYLLASNIPNTGYNRHFKWVKELNFKIVNYDKQVEIANKFEKINELIEIRNKEIEKLEELQASLMQEYFG